METMSQHISGSLSAKTKFNVKKVNNNRNSTADLQYKHEAIRVTQLQKIALCNGFTKAFNGIDFFNKSFPVYCNIGSGHNQAMGALINYAITGSYPDMHLEYEKVFISKGKLIPAQYAAAAPMKEGNIYFNFTDNSDNDNAAADKIILVAYAEALQQAVFTFNAGIRKNCEAILKTTSLKGYAVETWMGFLSADETNASNSVYTGRLQL